MVRPVVDGVAAEPEVVSRASVDDGDSAGRVRVSADSVDELIELCRAAEDPGSLLVAIDDVFGAESSDSAESCDSAESSDSDAFIALASVLVNGGVTAFETRRVQVVRRLFAMHKAIEAGSIEVLG